MFTNSFCSCTDCDSVLVLPPVEANQDCFEVAQSEVCGLLMFNDSASLPDDWTVKEDWEAVINNSDTQGGYGRYITGIGSIEAPERQQATAGKGFLYTVNTVYSVSFKINNLSDLHYAFLKQLQCSPRNYTFFVETVYGHILGSSVGIRPYFTTVDFVYQSGRGSVVEAIVTIQWKGRCEPERAYIPNLSENFTAAETGIIAYATEDGGTTVYAIADGSGTIYATTTN